MNDTSQRLIEQLAGDLQPRSPMKRRNGSLLVFASFAATLAATALLFGLVQGVAGGLSAPVYVLANGLLLVLGIAASVAVVSMAMPRVGAKHDAPKWAMATVGLLPLAAIGAALAREAGHAATAVHGHDLACFAMGVLFATLTAGVLLYWLRRGAPVSPNRAGLYLGVAAGAIGAFAYGVSCPLYSVWHIGVWHVMPVVAWGIVGRLAVPSLIRW